jgi:tetraacyldisaccharide 4'-kinase
MNNYLLSIMSGRRKGFMDQMIVYLLVPWTFFYRLGVVCHRNYCALLGRYKAPKPVISVGNITAGGAGKTPVVIWLAKNLQAKGLKSIILTRGYMPKASDVSDEADMLNEQIPYIPVLSGGNRAASVRKAEKTLPADIYICDDAFQHWGIHRDLNIVAIDAANPFGNGFTLPAGILREPLSALKRADIFVLTKTDGSKDVQGLTRKLKGINPGAMIVESRYKSGAAIDMSNAVLPEEFLKGKSVVGFCAIGDPLSFESSLKNSGAQIAGFFTYMDHHVYTPKDIRHLLEFCRSKNISVLATTHKDMVKLRKFKDSFKGVSLVYIPIQLEVIKGDNELFQKILSVCVR